MAVVAFLCFVLVYILTVSVEYSMINRTSEKMVFQAVGAEVKGWMEGEREWHLLELIYS